MSKKTTSYKNLKYLGSLIWGYKLRFFIGLIFLVVVDGLQLFIPKMIQHAIDKLTTGEATFSLVLLIGGGYLSLQILISILRFGWRYFISGTGLRIELDVRNKLYNKLQELSVDYYNHNKVGTIMSYATNDVPAIRMATGMALIGAVDALFMSIASITIMFYTNWYLSLFILLPFPLLAIVMKEFGRRMHKQFLSVQEGYSNLCDRVQESFSAIRVIKAYGIEQIELDHFNQQSTKLGDENLKLAKLEAVFNPCIMLFTALGTIILLCVGGKLVIEGVITLGEFSAMFFYLGLLTWPMMAIGWVINLIQRGSASIDRLSDVFDNQIDKKDAFVENIDSTIIEVKNLDFAYPKTDVMVLKNINFTIKQGQTIGIVGPTGSGKTTLIELLMNLYHPPKGTVSIDNQDINDIKNSTLHKLIGYVPQESFLFAMSIAENIAFGNSSMSQEDIIEVAKKAHIHDDIMAFNENYETRVGERGVTLSGGQKQRIAIARSLVSNNSLLFFDDCLSAVDTETESAILKEIQSAISNRTSILVSHRVNTVKNADFIIVLDNGEIIDIGTHEELINKDGYYNHLYNLQKHNITEGDIA